MSETTDDHCGVCGSENIGEPDEDASRGCWCNGCGAVYDIDEWIPAPTPDGARPGRVRETREE
jgi:hypothetical protein